METDAGESNSRATQKRMLQQIVAIPAILYFPARMVAQLNEICEVFGYTQGQLVIEALKGQIDYWEEFYDYVITQPEKPEDFIWPDDPMLCLACVTVVHVITCFNQCAHDPMAFAQLKADAPAEWSFKVSEEEEESDPADWWKTPSG